MSTLVGKSNRRKIKAQGPKPAAPGLATAWDQAIARPPALERVSLEKPTLDKLEVERMSGPPRALTTKVRPRHVMRPSRRGLLVATGIGAGVLGAEEGARAYRRRRAAVAKGRVVPDFVSEFMRSGEKYEAPRDILGGQSLRAPSAKKVVAPTKGKLLRRVVRKDADDLVMPFLGIPEARVRANPISPLAMLASSNIMIDTAAAAMGKNLSRRERKRAHQMGYGFAGARGMLFSPLGAGRTMVF